MASAVPVAPEQVQKAVRALLAHEKRREEARRGDKGELFQVGQPVFVTIGLKTVPERKIAKPHKISLRHPLYAESENGTCLIVKDTVKQDTKAFLEKHGVTGIAKVLTVEKLRKNYKEYEAKRQLSTSYDLFLADNRVLPLLPKLLGKHFFVKKKCARSQRCARGRWRAGGRSRRSRSLHSRPVRRPPPVCAAPPGRHPVPVEMRKGDLKRQLESALRCTYLHVSGQSIAVKVGHTAMSAQEIAENVCAAVGDIGGAVPGKWPAIQTLHLKTAESVALPLYNSLPDGAVAADPEPKASDAPAAVAKPVGGAKPKKRKAKEIQ